MMAVYFMYYNFGRVHPDALRDGRNGIGNRDHAWTIEELIALIG